MREHGKISKEQDRLTELKVLAELQRDSNENIETIAEKCGVSRQKVYRIIKNFRKNRTIWGCTAIIDEEERGLKKFLMLLKRTNQPLRKVNAESIAKGLLDTEYSKLGISIESNYYLHGEYDWAIVFTAQDLRQAKNLALH